MIITLTDVDDGDLTAEATEVGVQIEEVSRAVYNGSTVVSVTYRLVEEEETDEDDNPDESYELGYADGIRDGSLKRGQEQQAFDDSCASVSDDSARVYGLGSQGSQGWLDAGNRRPTAR